MVLERVRFTLRLVSELNNKLENEAKAKGVPKNALLVQILWEYAERAEKQKPA